MPGSRGANAPINKLRDIPLSGDSLFAQETIAEQRAVAIWDQNAEYGRRKLPEHETIAGALTELAADRGRGQFFYLPGRSSLTSASSESRVPKQRQLNNGQIRYVQSHRLPGRGVY